MSKPGRLWILTTEYEPYIIGGLGTVATNLSKAYAQSGVYTTVLSSHKQSLLTKVKKNQLQIIRFPLKAAYYSAKTKQFIPTAVERRLKGFKKPDGIHIHSLQFVNVAKYYKAKHRIPIVYTCHSLVAMENGPMTPKKRRMLLYQKQLLRTASKIVVPSRSHSAQLRKYYPFCAHKIVIIKHGIFLRKSHARGPSHRLLFVGRIVPSKGLDQLLKAVSLLKKQGRKVRLDVVGTGPKGYTRHLKARCRKLGISSYVRWMGFGSQTKVQQMYASHGALIMPSLQESFGLVALEALASGIPLVSTRTGGLAEFVNSDVAQTIPKVNGPVIAKSIQHMWNNKKLTNRRVAAGRKLASRFRWPHTASQYKKLFKKI